MEIEGCPLPEDRLYDPSLDVWLKPDDDPRTATIGITAVTAAFLGRFTSVTYTARAGPLRRGQSVATLESVRSVGPLPIPVEGTVLERNDRLRTRPKTLNDHPYEAGWVAKIALADPAAPGHDLQVAGAIAGRLSERIRRLRVLCLPAFPDVEMYEIGAECQAILVRLDETLSHLAPEEIVHLVTDDPTAPIEMVRWHDRTGQTVLHHRREGSLHHFLVRKEPSPGPGEADR